MYILDLFPKQFLSAESWNREREKVFNFSNKKKRINLHSTVLSVRLKGSVKLMKTNGLVTQNRD